MAKRGSRFRTVGHSSCFSFIGWTATAETVRSGKRDISPNSRGVIELKFRRNPSKYHYICKRRTLTFAEWQRWVKSGSPGSTWNELYYGAI